MEHRYPTLAEAARVWARIGLLSFGGPAGQIALMHRILVEEQRWIGEKRFLHALNFCMLLPGPEAMQLATYVGWLMHRVRGGVVAGLLFVLPGVVAIMALNWIYAVYGQVGFVAALFFGLKAAVLAIVLQAVVRIGGRALRGAGMVAVAAAAFVGLFALGLPFPLIVLAAGLGGYSAARLGWQGATGGGHGPAGKAVADAQTLLGEGVPDHARMSGAQGLRLGAVFLALWLVPVVVLVLALGPAQVFAAIALFFSKMAVLTFGGAYAVLAWVAQEAVQTHGWLAPGEMLDGLGMAETTPGPLIMVTQFVGFMGAFRDPGALSPLVAGTLGGLLTTWVTFAPCFLWIFVGAPFSERLRGNVALSAALATITAAVVGVILNLALWFGMHVVFAETVVLAGAWFRLELPVLASIDGAAAVLVLAALVAVFRLRVGTGALLTGAAAAGVVSHLLGLA